MLPRRRVAQALPALLGLLVVGAACGPSPELVTIGTIDCASPTDSLANMMLLLDGAGTNLLASAEYRPSTKVRTREEILSDLSTSVSGIQAVDGAANLRHYLFFSSIDDFARIIITDLGGGIQFDADVVWNGVGRIRTPSEWTAFSVRLPEPARVVPSCDNPRTLRGVFFFADPARVRATHSQYNLETWIAISDSSDSDFEAVFFMNRSDRPTLSNAFWVVLP
ncbi:MAG: hypothetical protein AMXMBFR34_24170 [Myxococcaceae bacterium]